MKNILKKLALLAIPVLLWLAFFIAFEPNNYFGCLLYTSDAADE